MHYTYILQSKKDNKFYIGFTNDLKVRFKQHNEGEVQSTKERRPFELVYYEACLDKQDALKREKYFKTGFGRRFLNHRLENFAQARDGGRGVSVRRLLFENQEKS